MRKVGDLAGAERMGEILPDYLMFMVESISTRIATGRRDICSAANAVSQFPRCMLNWAIGYIQDVVVGVLDTMLVGEVVDIWPEAPMRQ